MMLDCSTCRVGLRGKLRILILKHAQLALPGTLKGCSIYVYELRQRNISVTVPSGQGHSVSQLNSQPEAQGSERTTIARHKGGQCLSQQKQSNSAHKALQ